MTLVEPLTDLIAAAGLPAADAAAWSQSQPQGEASFAAAAAATGEFLTRGRDLVARLRRAP